MSTAETQRRPLTSRVDDEGIVDIPSLNEAAPRSSVVMPVSGDSGYNMSTPRALKKPNDIRYYFRPVPKEDIRIYFRPLSKFVPDHPRVARAGVLSSTGKPKVRSCLVSPNGRASPMPKLEVPPKAKGRTSGQKNREIFLSKQRETQCKGGPGRTNQNGSIALPGFDPSLTDSSHVPPGSPLSPRITEVVDSSLMPSPLRNKSDVAAGSAPEFDDQAENKRHRVAPSSQPAPEYQQSIVQEYQQTTLPHKPNSIYGTLPPLPVRLQRNNSQPTLHSPGLVRHRRQDTPYSPNDVGRDSELDNPRLPERESAASDPVGCSSSYASSDVLPTPITLEEWAGEQRRIAHGQPALIPKGADSTLDSANKNEEDKIVKKTKSIETRLFRSRKGKAEKDKEMTEIKKRLEQPQPVYRPQASRVILQKPHHRGRRWDVATLPPSPEIVRASFTTVSSDMDNNQCSSDSMSDKMVVTDPQLTRAQTNQNSSMTKVTKTKKPNKFLRMLEAYSKNVEGLQMVQ